MVTTAIGSKRYCAGMGSLDRTRFPWTPVWANEAGRPEGIGDEPGEGWSGGGDGDGGSGAADGRGATRAVECAGEDGDRDRKQQQAAVEADRRAEPSPGEQVEPACTARI